MIDEGLQEIGTEEHRRLLERAFKNAKELVIVESPWLTPDAIDADFKRWLFDGLDRGLNVVIAWGYPDEGKVDNQRKNDRSRSIAATLLEQAKRPRTDRDRKKAKAQKAAVVADGGGTLRIVELGDTHSKTLVADLNFAVISSFNWLSFRGSRRAGQLRVRNETGYRIGIPEKVQLIRDSLLRRIESASAARVGSTVNTVPASS
jgi:hypothetical protein